MPLKVLFPDLFQKANNKSATIGEYWGRSRWRWSSTALSGQNFARVRGIKQLLKDSVPSALEEDKPIWIWEKDGNFTVESVYRHFINSGVIPVNTKWIWKAKRPHKIRVFLWLVCKETLLTWQNLQKRGCSGPNICVLCRKAEESAEHIMLSCCYSRSV